MGNHLKQGRGQGSHGSLFAQDDPLWTEATSKLSQMEPEWFRGKRILDIGSHEGAFDLALAARFGPKLLIGVEIDHKLTSKSMKNMHECINNSETMALIHSELKKNNQDQHMNSAEDAKEEAADPIQDKINDLMKRIKDLPKSMQLSIQGQINSRTPEAKLTSKLTSDRDTLPSPKDMKSYLYGKVSFRTENYIASIQPSQDVLLKNEKFDTIMCLSTSKYIHLNFGDQGINALFLKVYHQLESGGHFILEPQQWKSYKKEKSRCPQFKEMCESVIQLKPGLFLRYLKEIGFHHVKTIQYTCPSNKEKIVYVLKKA
jgi:7SK snRNA methylphosphate capping enzyme